MSIAEVRELAQRHTVDEIEQFIERLLEYHELPDGLEGTEGEVLATLSKAESVRFFIDQGMSPIDAVRELARRIRRVSRPG